MAHTLSTNSLQSLNELLDERKMPALPTNSSSSSSMSKQSYRTSVTSRTTVISSLAASYASVKTGNSQQQPDDSNPSPEDDDDNDDDNDNGPDGLLRDISSSSGADGLLRDTSAGSGTRRKKKKKKKKSDAMGNDSSGKSSKRKSSKKSKRKSAETPSSLLLPVASGFLTGAAGWGEDDPTAAKHGNSHTNTTAHWVDDAADVATAAGGKDEWDTPGMKMMIESQYPPKNTELLEATATLPLYSSTAAAAASTSPLDWSASSRCVGANDFQSFRKLQPATNRRASAPETMEMLHANAAASTILSAGLASDDSVGILSDLRSFTEENMSVLTGENDLADAALMNFSCSLSQFNPTGGRYDNWGRRRTPSPARKVSSSGLSTTSDPNHVSHDLLVNYMMAMGANRETAEDLAYSFEEEQAINIRGGGPGGGGGGGPGGVARRAASYTSRVLSPGRPVQPAAVRLSDKVKEAEAGHHIKKSSSRRQIRQQRSGSDLGSVSERSRSVRHFQYQARLGGSRRSQASLHAVHPDQQQQQQYQGMEYTYEDANANMMPRTAVCDGDCMDDDNSSWAHIIEAMPVKDYESELPIAYADTKPLSFKGFINDHPVQLLFCLAFLTIVGIVIGIVYVTILNVAILSINEAGNGDTGVTGASTLSPSLSPTFVSNEILLAAAQLSGFDILKANNSPQFKAVGWLSTVDEIGTGGLGGQAFAQRYALTVMYYSFRGEDWFDQENWLAPNLHECEWSNGISCEFTETGLVVKGFDATRNNLQGSIPAEIGLLHSSEIFRIPMNKVGGTIPTSIGRMTSLSTIDLSDNELTGAIPETFEGTRDMVILDLSQNQLTSSIPSEFFNLNFLRTIILHSNQLTGSISPSINGLTSLVTLDLRHNEISGTVPFTLDSITTLDTIMLDYNKLTGQLPPVTPSFGLKRTLSLSHNQFSGNVVLHPTWITEQPSLDDLRLQHVDVSYNMLTGPISPMFIFLPTLRYFDLSGNKFDGTFPSHSGWETIEHLAFADNAVTGTVPVGFTSLTHLDFSNNLLTDGVPEDLCDYANLEFLILSGNQLGSTIPSCLGKIPKLRDLELGNCSLTGPIPPAFDRLVDLNILYLQGNMLTSTIPVGFGNISNMKDLELQDNMLEGPIPSHLGNLVNLNVLNLTNNDLLGSIPTELEALVDLESLSLRGNADLRGEIPPGLCGLSNLELLAERDIGCSVGCDCCIDVERVCGV